MFTPDETSCTTMNFETAGEVPVGEAAWSYYDGSKWVVQRLTVAELSAAEAVQVERASEAAAAALAAAAFDQAERCPGFRVGGLPAGKHPTLCGVFRRDAAAPDANGRPHYSTAEGGHLYYSTIGKWLLRDDGFFPAKTGCDAKFATAGEVPVGEAAWRYNDGGKWAVGGRGGSGEKVTAL